MMKLSLIVLVVLLCGCASYEARPIDPESRQTAFESRRLDSAEVRRFMERALGHPLAPWPPDSWDLTTLTLAAFSLHPELDLARAQRLATEAAIVTAGARPNPAVGASFQRNTDAAQGQSPWTNGLTAVFPIETAGKRDDRIDMARHRAQAARLRQADTVWRVRSRVRSSLLAAYPTEASLFRQRGLQEQIVRMLEKRFAAGFASQSEVTQARLALNRSALVLRDAQKQRAESLARLGAAIGVPVGQIDGKALSFDVFEQVPKVSGLPPPEARRQALLRRPDVLAALADYDASQSALQLEVAKQYPDVSLGPAYSWDAGAVKWTLGLSLVLPLLNRNQGPIAEAEARRREAGATFSMVQAKAIAEVDEALASYVNAIRTFEAAESLLRNQRKTERDVAASVKAGESDRLAWVSAQYETAAGELGRVTALTQAQQSLGRLEDALRRPLGTNALGGAEQEILSEPDKP